MTTQDDDIELAVTRGSYFTKKRLLEKFRELAELKDQKAKQDRTCSCINIELARFTIKEIEEIIGEVK